MGFPFDTAAGGAFLILSGFVLAWDIFLAGKIARLRSAPTVLAALSALAGLLVLPAVLVAVTGSSALTGRAVHIIGWLWPATLALFAAQAIAALALRRIPPIIGVPIATYDALIAAAAIVRYALALGGAPPPDAIAIVGAQENALGRILGAAVLASPFALQMPLLAPAYPAVWRASAPLRLALAVAAGAWAALVVADLPPALYAATSYTRYATERMQERPPDSFSLGLRILPPLTGLPPSLALRNDLSLADTLEPDVVMVVVEPEAVRAGPLDSLARALDQLRRDSTQLVIALGYGPTAAERFRASPDRWARDRLRDVDQIARRVRPDYLLPADEPYGRGATALGSQPVGYWRRYLTDAANAAHRVNRRIRVGVAAGGFDARDSALFAWAVSAGSPLDAAGFTLFPSFMGGVSLDARLATADRWLRLIPRGRRTDLWVWSAGGLPLVHGEQSQERAVWRAITWATTHPEIDGLIVGEAGDYVSLDGLRAADGRVRPVAATVRRAARALREQR